jgi:antitoxin ParD1/3/4
MLVLKGRPDGSIEHFAARSHARVDRFSGQAGEYTNASDYIRDLIRHDQRQREALRLALIEAEESGVSGRKAGDIVVAANARIGHG